jgi:integrase/recombinase XerD
MNSVGNVSNGSAPDPARQQPGELIESSLDPFRRDLALRGLAQQTVRRNCCSARQYLVWAAERGIDAEKGRKDDLLEYLATLRASGIQKTSILAIFISLNAWYEFLVESGRLEANPIPPIRKRYLKNYKDEVRQRQLISVEDAAKIVRATMDVRDRAILLVFLKTGIRRNELISLDLQDLDIVCGKIVLKPTGKRSNRMVFFDDECARAMTRWLKSREMRFQKGEQTALFTSGLGTRLQASRVDELVRVAAERVGLHDHASEKLEERFTPHCCRHWFTTHLRRAGMPREFIQELRGDKRKEAIDIYDHIDHEELKKSYLAHIPQLGV